MNHLKNIYNSYSIQTMSQEANSFSSIIIVSGWTHQLALRIAGFVYRGAENVFDVTSGLYCAIKIV